MHKPGILSAELSDSLGFRELVGDERPGRGAAENRVAERPGRDAEVASDLLARVTVFGAEPDGLTLEVVGVGDAGQRVP